MALDLQRAGDGSVDIVEFATQPFSGDKDRSRTSQHTYLKVVEQQESHNNSRCFCILTEWMRKRSAARGTGTRIIHLA